MRASLLEPYFNTATHPYTGMAYLLQRSSSDSPYKRCCLSITAGADPWGVYRHPPPPPPPPPSTSDHTPCLHVGPTYSVGTSSSKLNEAQCWTSSNGKQLVTVRMNHIQSQLLLGTKPVLNSDHVHGESSSDVDVGDSRLATSRVRCSRMTW